MDTILASLHGLIAFFVYFASGIGLLLAFAVLYALVTPYDELKLIRAGNTTAACSYSGALLGFTVPLASAVAHSVSLIDMVIWGIVALSVQIVTFLAIKLIFPHIVEDIPHNQLAQGVFLGGVSLLVGILNAACMSY